MTIFEGFLTMHKYTRLVVLGMIVLNPFTITILSCIVNPDGH